jgi:hypothetical protein
MGGRYDVLPSNRIMPEMAARLSFASPDSGKSASKLGFCSGSSIIT